MISYQWIKSKRKTIAIHIGEHGTVIVKSPYGVTKKQIESFINQKSAWIEKHRNMVLAAEEEQVDISDEERIYGIEKAKELFPQRVAYYAEVMHISYGRIAIREQKTRWGSCSSKGNLNFNWKLILMPPDLLDYVVVHELAHRIEMNHSEKFWKVVESVMPDYKKRRELLKKWRI